jgi:hypothetical protein
VYHPEYDSELNNDVAILFLPEEIHNITAVLLNANNRVPTAGDPLDVSGWGKLDQDGPLKKIAAQAITVDYLSNDACTRKPYRYKNKLVTDGMMCAFAEGKDHCGGDSGTPHSTSPSHKYKTVQILTHLISIIFKLSESF